MCRNVGEISGEMLTCWGSKRGPSLMARALSCLRDQSGADMIKLGHGGVETTTGKWSGRMRTATEQERPVRSYGREYAIRYRAAISSSVKYGYAGITSPPVILMVLEEPYCT
jgi:hypothetical protein